MRIGASAALGSHSKKCVNQPKYPAVPMNRAVASVYAARPPIALYAGWPMYGVVCKTPPSSAPSTDVTPSVRRMVRVSYSSPALAALSVQSIPPTMVARANGTATGSLASDDHQTCCHQLQSHVSTGRKVGGAHAVGPADASAPG